MHSECDFGNGKSSNDDVHQTCLLYIIAISYVLTWAPARVFPGIGNEGV